VSNTNVSKRTLPALESRDFTSPVLVRCEFQLSGFVLLRYAAMCAGPYRTLKKLAGTSTLQATRLLQDSSLSPQKVLCHRRRHGIKCGYAECEAQRADVRGPKGRERGMGSWGAPPHQLGGQLGGAAGSVSEPRKILNLMHFGT